jgi:hypothetical protein
MRASGCADVPGPTTVRLVQKDPPLAAEVADVMPMNESAGALSKQVTPRGKVSPHTLERGGLWDLGNRVERASRHGDPSTRDAIGMPNAR